MQSRRVPAKSVEALRAPRHLAAFAALFSVLGLATIAGGCITVYQPLRSIQRPVAIDPQMRNLVGVRLSLYCIPGGDVDRSGAKLLCRRVDTLLAQQGATVVTFDDGAVEEPGDGNATDLHVELRARLLHKEKNNFLFVLSYMTATLVPAYSEYSFAQDVTIRDSTGFLLASTSLEARFVRYFGVGIWGLNWLLDRLVREEPEKVGGRSANRDFSRDFYGQISQLVFNAENRRRVLTVAQGEEN